ncbi:hypothetical protein GGQ74_002853 [Desulfobaculum xiamenense]|uniref:HTH merR-type domain-containing protein n=1 Tax=Desulfobaculum xiamenense TaxID=995050 RepID=A0A846QJT4_9BACT|nr:helix-turn-helix domain-containing protein [Desulfobaculum xiamenense]NJB69156.1 hypothetical protein [Desulfobaculum xiamenense]
MADDLLTHAEIARQLGVSVSTIKNYRSKFPECLPVARRGKPLRFAAVSLAVCRTVHEGFGEGLSTERIRETLYERFPQYAKARRARAASRDNRRERVGEPALERSLARMEDVYAAVISRMNELEGRTTVAPTDGDGPLRDEVLRLRDEVGRLRRAIETGSAVAERTTPQVDGPASPQESQGVADGPSVTKGETPRARERVADDVVADILGLPLVIRSPGGEYLGVTLPGGGHLDVSAMLARLGARSAAADWTRSAGGWTLLLGEGVAAGREFDLRPVTTPRGNRVALLCGMRVAGRPADAGLLRSFLRTLRGGAEAGGA